MSENILNDMVEVVVEDAAVITVPIDDTLSHSMEAADAAAVGAALALKADLSQVAGISVNGQAADLQGKILIDGSDIPVNGTDTRKLDVAVGEALNRTAADIPMSAEPGADSIAEVINSTVDRTADAIALSEDDETTVTEAVTEIQEDVTDLQATVEAQGTADGILYEAEGEDTVKDKIDDLYDGRVKTVNAHGADSSGNIELTTVPFADDLASTRMTQVAGKFIVRTTAGTASISDGDAQLLRIQGSNEHPGYIAEVLKMDVVPMARDDEDPIEATIDPEEFKAAVSGDVDLTFVYATGWNPDPEDYGITVTGTAIAGDIIMVHYIKEERGTITQAFSEAGDKTFISTGWNLFNAEEGWARVAAYNYKYKVGGPYSTIRFKDNPGDESSYAVTVDGNGLFSVPRDGYIVLTGGNETETYVITAWTDWTGGYPGTFQGYSETVIDLTSVLASFPYGLCRAGSVYDELDFSVTPHKATQRIGRMAYSAANRAAAEASGRAYEFDEDYIYYELAQADIQESTFSLSNEFTANSHGIEYFTGTSAGATAEAGYIESLKDKLQRDVATLSQQTLEENVKAQVRENIGAASAADIDSAISLLNGSLLVKKYTYKFTSQIAGNGTKSLTAETMGIVPIEGYTPALAVCESTGNSYLTCYALHPVTTGTVISFRNLSSSAQNNKTITLRYLFIKDNLVRVE